MKSKDANLKNNQDELSTLNAQLKVQKQIYTLKERENTELQSELQNMHDEILLYKMSIEQLREQLEQPK